jgi:hypothetical protein
MTLTEIQKLRNNLNTISQSKDQMYEVWFLGLETNPMNKRLDAVNKHLEILEENVFEILKKEETKILKQ